MKRLNNKAFTVVELIVTFAIVMTISLGLFKIIDSYKDRQEAALYKKELLNYRNEIIKTVKDDIYKLGLKGITGEMPTGTLPTNEGIRQSIKIKFKDNSEKYFYFGQSGSSGCYNRSTNTDTCSGRYFIKYGNSTQKYIKYSAPSDFIVFEDDVIYSCDAGDVVTTSRALEIIDPSTIKIKEVAEKYCRINVRMKNTELKDEIVLRISSLTYNTTSTETPFSGGNIRKVDNKPNITEIELPSATADSIPSSLASTYLNSTYIGVGEIKKVRITCESNPTIEKIDLINQWTNNANATLIIGHKCTEIKDEAFKNFTGIKTLVFEEEEAPSLTKIGKSAFEGVPLKGTITIPKSFVANTRINSRAFYGNYLTRIILQSQSVKTETVGDTTTTTALFEAGTEWAKDHSGNNTPIVILK